MLSKTAFFNKQKQKQKKTEIKEMKLSEEI